MLNRIIVLILISFISNSCARVGRPTGGEKDELPPVIINASPDFGTINFNSTKIRINFNEYIKLKELNKQLIISPPLTYTPIITPQGYPAKYITIKLKDTLKENTTYTFNFGNAIIDNAEGNILKRFKYLFSTGKYIDSSAVLGRIINAFHDQKESNISVVLYVADSTYYDSIIYKEKPTYVTNTLDSIGFSISNIKEGRYHLFAIKDVSNNLIYNPKEDEIAFLGSIINTKKDTIYQLKLFKEQPDFTIKNISEVSKNHILIGFEGENAISILSLKDKNENIIDYTSYKDTKTDTLHLWHKGVDIDSLIIKIQAKDTIVFRKKRLRKKEIDSIQLSSSLNNTINFKDSLFILSNTPISRINKSLINIIDKDSADVSFAIIKNNNRFFIDFIKKESEQYKVTVLPYAVEDFYGQKNDSVQFTYKTKKKNDYGEIIVNIVNNNNYKIFMELLNKKEKLINRVFIENERSIKFDFLKPDKYKLRVILDENVNDKWDTGNLIERKQPERIIYHTKTIEVRANWSISEELIIE